MSLVVVAVVAASWSATTAADAQDDYQPDQQLVADVRGYAAETANGYDHVLRWMRVLRTLGVLDDMTAAEAQGYADTYWAKRWDPVVEELTKLESAPGSFEPDSQVVADVRSYAAETANGYDHVLRWMRVLRTLGALDDMTAAEAQGYANRGWPRWEPVAAELAALENSRSASPTPTPTTAPEPTPAPEPANKCADGEPEGVTALRADQQIVVSWTTPVAPESCELTGFVVAIDWGGIKSQISAGPDDTSITEFDLGLPEFEVTVSATYEAEPVAMLSSHCTISLTLTTDVAHEVSGSWATSGSGCESGGIRVHYRKTGSATWDISPLFRQTSGKFIWGDMDPAAYEFKLETTASNGSKHTSTAATMTPLAGTPGVKAVSNLAGDTLVNWSGPAPGVSDVTGYVVRYREAHAHDFSTVDVANQVCRSTNSMTNDCNMWINTKAHNLDAELDSEKSYWIEVGTTGTSNGETVTRYSTPVKAPTDEPFMVWFIDNTPTPNFLTDRVFMMVDTNHGDSSAVCKINGGAINCPPRTLVSLDIIQGGTYNTWANAVAGGVASERTTSTVGLSTGDTPSAANPQPYDAGMINGSWASGGTDTAAIGWRNTTTQGRPASGDYLGRKVSSYVVKLTKPDATAVWVPVDRDLDADGNETGHYSLEIPDLSAGEYTVEAYPCANVASATEVKQCTSGTDETQGVYLGALLRSHKVTVGPEKAGLPGAPTGVSASGGAGKVTISWTHPRIESNAPSIHHYYVRLSPADGDPIYRKVVSQTPLEIRSKNSTEVLNYLEAGTYAVAIQSRNANGGSEWVPAGTRTVS